MVWIIWSAIGLVENFSKFHYFYCTRSKSLSNVPTSRSTITTRILEPSPMCFHIKCSIQLLRLTFWTIITKIMIGLFIQKLTLAFIAMKMKLTIRKRSILLCAVDRQLSGSIYCCLWSAELWSKLTQNQSFCKLVRLNAMLTLNLCVRSAKGNFYGCCSCCIWPGHRIQKPSSLVRCDNDQ